MGKTYAGEMVGMTQISLLFWPHGKKDEKEAT